MIIVPRVEPVQEQWLRAERMARIGLLRALHPDDLTPDALLGAVEEELACGNVRSLALQTFAMDGLPRIAEALQEGLAEALPADVGAPVRAFRRTAPAAGATSPLFAAAVAS
jgi:predicted glycosyltransferase